MKRHRSKSPVPLQMPVGLWSYGRVLPFARAFEFMFEFMFDLMFVFELDMFVFDIGVDGAIGVTVAIGVAMFTFVRFALLTVLFDVASPQAIPSADTDNIAVSAIFFIKYRSPSSSKLEILVLTTLNRGRLSLTTADHEQAPL